MIAQAEMLVLFLGIFQTFSARCEPNFAQFCKKANLSLNHLTMTLIELEKLRYPIGHFKFPKNFDPDQLANYTQQIADLPNKLREATATLSEAQLETPYREGGWTVRQLVHHIADSHVNLYTRIKLTLTENAPTIKPYQEQAWAELEDSIHAPIDLSLNILDSIHARAVMVINAIKAEELERMFIHPDVPRPMPLYACIAIFAWHGNHHLAHITGLIDRSKW